MSESIEKHSTFLYEYASQNGLESLIQYLESSRKIYEIFGIDVNTDFLFDPEKEELSLSVKPQKDFQGYENIIHGGYTSFLLDSTTGILALIKRSGQNKIAPTAKLSIKYLLPVEPEKDLNIRANIIGEKLGLLHVKAHINQGEEVVSEGEGYFSEK